MKKIVLLLLITFLFLISSTSHSQAAISVTSASGHATDIQVAVNQVAAVGGGDVHIPEGTWNFYEPGETWGPVTIPAGVNLFGAPTQRDANDQVIEWKTILIMPYEAPDGVAWFEYEINNNLPFRVSDLKLVGYRYYNSSSVAIYNGISITGPYTSYPDVGVLDFRIDHCHFQDMCRSALWFGPHAEHNRRVYRGVIDHNIFNNTYGDPGFMRYEELTLGYGIGMRRWASDFWDYNTSNVVGHYNNYTIFIEDNYFSKWRHGVCSNDGIHYVFRHNIVEDDYATASIDGHGSYADDSHSYAVGTRAIEAYENIFRNPDTTWYDKPWAINHRGGAGIFFNNTLEGYYAFMDLNNDWGNYEPYCPHCRINDTYIWNNNLGGGRVIKYNSDSQENVHYFLRPPNLAQDGWEYIPYPYPHPLTIEPSNKHRLWGRLLDANNQPVQSEIFAFIEGTDTLITSNQTDANGDYGLEIQPGTYDIHYRILTPGFYVPNFILRFYSINVNKSIQNLIKTITDYPAEKKIAFIPNITPNQRIQMYSHIKPARVRINGTLMAEVSSISNLGNNTWYYDSNKKTLHMLVTPLIVVTAASGSAEDIQTAINQLATRGGGIVYVPAGEWGFDLNISKTLGGRYCGVLVPGGISVIGAGENSTILRMSAETAPDTTGLQGAAMFCVNGRQNYPSPVRISGIKFVGYVNYSKTCRDGTRCDEYIDEPEWSATVGMRIEATVDFRVDHCTFEDFTSTSVSTVRGGSAVYECRGVIDHCTFFSPYKEIIDGVRWGYGIIVTGMGSDSEWVDPDTLYGKYGDGVSVTYIEDCYFKDSRHHTDSNSVGYYVLRHSTIKKTIPETYGSVNTHEGNPGSFLTEAYNNIIEDEPVEDPNRFGPGYVGRYMGNAVCFRGGKGLVWGNIIKSHRVAIQIMHYNETLINPKYQPKDIYIWDNTYVDVQNIMSYDPVYVIENMTYFLYEKPGYISYVYPHPLTLED